MSMLLRPSLTRASCFTRPQGGVPPYKPNSPACHTKSFQGWLPVTMLPVHSSPHLAPAPTSLPHPTPNPFPNTTQSVTTTCFVHTILCLECHLYQPTGSNWANTYFSLRRLQDIHVCKASPSVVQIVDIFSEV